MEKEPKIRLAILNELIEEIKTGDYLPYFSDKGEGEFPLAIGREEDLKLLSDLSVLMKEASLCALGTTAPNIVITTLKYFREEYEAHIYYNICPAKVCKPLISYVINKNKCAGCGSCMKACPVDAITGENKKPHTIDDKSCIKCGSCMEACPEKYSAVEKKTGMVAGEEREKKEIRGGMDIKSK